MHRSLTTAALLLGVPLVALTGQEPVGKQGSSNMHVVAHIPLGSHVRTGDVEIEQELSRPYAYINTRKDISGFDIISLQDPARAHVIYGWRIANPELHLGG